MVPLSAVVCVVALASLCASLETDVGGADVVLAYQHFIRALSAKQGDAEISRVVVYSLYDEFAVLVEPLFESLFNPSSDSEDVLSAAKSERPRAQLLDGGRDIVCADDIETDLAVGIAADEGRDYRITRRPHGAPCRLEDVALVFRVRFAGALTGSACIGVPLMRILDPDFGDAPSGEF